MSKQYTVETICLAYLFLDTLKCILSYISYTTNTNIFNEIFPKFKEYCEFLDTTALLSTENTRRIEMIKTVISFMELNEEIIYADKRTEENLWTKVKSDDTIPIHGILASILPRINYGTNGYRLYTNILNNITDQIWYSLRSSNNTII